MPPTDSTAIIVARFLKSNNYTESYNAFITESGLPFDAGTVSKGDLTVEQLLDEKKAFDLSTQFEKLGVDETDKKWTTLAPGTAVEYKDLPSVSNILTLSAVGNTLLATTADRKLHMLNPGTLQYHQALSDLQDSPILSCTGFRSEYLLTGSMSGQLILGDMEGKVIETRRDHSKYIVKIAVYNDDLIATAGWDSKISFYRPTEQSDGSITLGNAMSIIELQTKPEAMVFTKHPENGEPILIVSRTDSSSIYFYTVESPPRLLGRQNLAPHSNAWVAFTPSAFELCPTDSSLLAIALSTVPHMKLAIIQLLIPPYTQETTTSAAPVLRTSLLDDNPAATTQASQARAELVIADREHAAIKIHCTTLAPQTPYSTPAVAWRPDGSGVWVNGDDGTVRGIEANSGKIIKTLKGHAPDSKVRCLWAGLAENGDELLVSGGFDQKLIIWMCTDE